MESSFLTGCQIHLPCTGRQMLHHWTSREVPKSKLLEKDIGENLWDLGIGKELEDLTSKTWSLEGTIYIWASSKLKTFALSKALLRGQIINHRGEDIRNALSDKRQDLMCIQNYQSSTVKSNPIQKWAKDVRRYFIEEDLQMAISRWKCLTSLAVREMQIKITTRCPCTPIRTVK